MANFDDFYKSFPKDEDLKWRFFEQEVVPWFLKEEPLFSSWISKVWTFNDYPRKWNKKDLGTDLVFEDIYGNDWAVQAKCYDPKNYVSKKDIDSFISDSNRKQIKGRLLIITTNLIGENAINTLEGQEKESKVFRLDDFRKANINYPINSINIQKKYFIKPHRPRTFQQKAISNAIKYLKNNDRGKLIMACGTGKTLTSLWIQEEAKYKRILYLVPSLYLVKQSLSEWINNKTDDFEWQCVCSDKTVDESLNKDYFAERKVDVCVPITTEINDIKSFLLRDKKKVVFCTYDSLPLIAEVFKDDTFPSFDITFADESHRCVGHDKKIFGLIVEEGAIKTKKRIFMTATPINLKDQDKDKAIENGINFYSMDDEKSFGKEIFKITFREAINKKPPLLTNYQVFVIAVEDDPLLKEKILKRKILSTDGSNEINAEELTTHIALAKGIKKYDLKKIITFHTKNDWAKEFAEDHLEIIKWLDKKSLPGGITEYLNINGEMKIFERETILDKLNGCHKNKRTIISNARCLTEGIDVPSLDGIAFINPIKSEQNIIQAIGRVIRIDKDNKDKIGTILIPVDLGNCEDIDQEALSTRFSKVWEVVNALKFHDEYLKNEIENLRIELGKRPKPGKRRKGLEIIKYSLPEKISKEFAESIETLLIKNTSENWHEMYGKLLQFVEDNGHARVKRDDPILGNWIGTQRKNFINEIPALTPERIQLLDKLIEKGWSWNIHEETSNKYIFLFEEYLKNNDHLIIRGSEKKYYGPAASIRSLYKRNPNFKEHLPTFKRLNELSRYWMWDPIVEIPLEKIRLLKEWCKTNKSVMPSRKIIHPGSPKTFNHFYRRTNFNLGIFSSECRSRYRYMRYGSHPEYKGEFNNSTLNKRELSKEEINALESIPNWYWETWEGYVRVYKKCFEEDIKIVPTTKVDFDAKEVRGIGSWVSRMRNKAIKRELKTHMIITLESLPNWTYEPNHDAFMRGINEFFMHTKDKKDKDIPQNAKTKTGFNLGGWVSDVRSRYKNKKRLSQINRYSELYKNLLDHYGFLWTGNDLRGNNLKIKDS